MKFWIPMLILTLSVLGLCVWDFVYTKNVFNTLENKSEFIYNTLQNIEVTDTKVSHEILSLNDYWTKKMDILSISISRKDMQPISDYLQYLCASIKNESQEDAITYSRLLKYNILGLKETTVLSWVNLL